LELLSQIGGKMIQFFTFTGGIIPVQDDTALLGIACNAWHEMQMKVENILLPDMAI
jgi:hypothetical protein